MCVLQVQSNCTFQTTDFRNRLLQLLQLLTVCYWLHTQISTYTQISNISTIYSNIYYILKYLLYTQIGPITRPGGTQASCPQDAVRHLDVLVSIYLSLLVLYG